MLRNKNLWLVCSSMAVMIVVIACQKNEKGKPVTVKLEPGKPTWIIPDTSEITNAEQAKLVSYGRALIVNTAYYFGPKGMIAHKSNGLNCQNCHLNAGTKLFGNNFSLVAVGYPRFKDRSGTVETVVKKVEDCFERSLNGARIDSNSGEMKAFVAYLEWIGKNVKKGTKPQGSGIEELPFLSRAADTAKGQIVYLAKCQLCHGKNGEGILKANGVAYIYPPLWGRNSYNIGASIYRLSKLTGYVKRNMPFNVDKGALLSDEQAWDVSAFINSKYHPYKNIDSDWPKLSTKPYDYPFGPYADQHFTANQRKYGPYEPIKKYYAASGMQKGK